MDTALSILSLITSNPSGTGMLLVVIGILLLLIGFLYYKIIVLSYKILSTEHELDIFKKEVATEFDHQERSFKEMLRQENKQFNQHVEILNNIFKDFKMQVNQKLDRLEDRMDGHFNKINDHLLNLKL